MTEQVREKPLSTAEIAKMDERPPTEAGTPGEMEKEVEARREKTATKAVMIAEEEWRPLLASQEASNLHSRWDTLQAGFVDSPRQSVEQADTLVAEVTQRLSQIIAGERAQLEGQWSREEDVSTEDLRIALQRYRSFFGRLLSF